ncbi:MarR family winged helix-turn-helix transcriptional regulator [Umezawaea sp. Da 62-37]|uniref:MarR family winged helix-turn-helix transcriptional regulator n=1 Tax=Umezawaea sp. Da 62-37 TaxID=3075927 RepID=UPI0028F702DC|nr:MarR family winged helix-turn-helix transcriptional regulator [Umezawaea sp. Da 62-37]WNV86902.1 MarR family winged helix-turn-helix transcriptional regulator [Umezawaea sp. Da 62-37]
MTRTHQQIGLSVKRLQARHHRMANARLASLDISLVQWDALRHLAANPEASLHDLAQLTFQTDQSFGALASRMVERGLIERVPGPGRAIRHRLTEKGDELRVAGAGLMDEVLEESFKGLTAEELQTFGRLLAVLLESTAEV